LLGIGLRGHVAQAAIRAGYSEKTAAVIGTENLIKPNIAAVIQAAMDARSERTQVTANKVVEEIAEVALAGLRQ